MKLAMLATTAITTLLLIPSFAADSPKAQPCDEMLSIREVVVVCENEDRSDEINKIYREILGRDAESEGLKTWSRKLERSTIKKIRREIAESQEAKMVLNRVYQEVLGRNVDPSGLKTYTKNLKKNWTLSDVRRDIQQSEEAMMKVSSSLPQ
jgi:hypothetical protein